MKKSSIFFIITAASIFQAHAMFNGNNSGFTQHPCDINKGSMFRPAPQNQYEYNSQQHQIHLQQEQQRIQRENNIIKGSKQQKKK